MPRSSGPYHPGMTMTPPSSATSDPIVHARIVSAPLATSSPSNHGDLDANRGGATCTFEGITRPETHPEHGDLVALRYEAAEPLATNRMKNLAAEIAQRHSLHRITVEHAIGEVTVGESSVRITTVADHREAAFVACREMIDRLKSEIPIWKQECWITGSTWSAMTSPLPEATSQEPIR